MQVVLVKCLSFGVGGESDACATEEIDYSPVDY